MNNPRQRLPNGAWQCTATSKTSHERCKANALRGTDVCKNHGGRQAQTSIGPMNPNYKTGRHSRWMSALPSRYHPAYVAALSDPELLSLESDIAVIDARLAELMTRLTGSAGTWGDVTASYDALIVAMKAEDKTAIRSALIAMRDLVHGAVSNDKEWREVGRLVERKRRLIASERKRLLEEELFLSREQAHAYAVALLETVTRHVADRATLERIAGDLHTVTSAGRRKPIH